MFYFQASHGFTSNNVHERTMFPRRNTHSPFKEGCPITFYLVPRTDLRAQQGWLLCLLNSTLLVGFLQVKWVATGLLGHCSFDRLRNGIFFLSAPVCAQQHHRASNVIIHWPNRTKAQPSLRKTMAASASGQLLSALTLTHSINFMIMGCGGMDYTHFAALQVIFAPL